MYLLRPLNIVEQFNKLQCPKSMMGSLFSYVATHQLSHLHNTKKCWFMSSVNSALDETRANHDCQEVYGSGEWEHCCVSMEISVRRGKNGYISWKLLLRYSSQSFQIGQGQLTSLSQPSTKMSPFYQDGREKWYSIFVSGDVGNAVLEKIPVLFGHSPQGQVPSGQPRATSLNEL